MRKETVGSPFFIKEVVKEEFVKNPVLIPEHQIYIHLLTQKFARVMAGHYRQAFERGDFFGSRYQDLSATVFNPDWFRQEVYNPGHIWIVFTQNSDLVGSTGLFYEDGAVSIDETQIDPKGRGFGIMNHYFRMVVPTLERLRLDITTEFVLTPQSKGLRRTLQTELGMVALGIHPNDLFHRQTYAFVSETSAAKYHHLVARKPVIVPQFVEIYSIVQAQLDLPDPAIINLESETDFLPKPSKRYEEITVSASNPQNQLDAVKEGYSPVKFDPKRQTFSVAKFPLPKPNLQFIIAENIKANSQLVDYLSKRLYP